MARLDERPDVTLRALVAELVERGIKVSYYAVWQFLDHEGISFKKMPCTPASRIGRTSRGGEASGASIREDRVP
ncbi:MAG: hypothetical protein U1E23_06575 [Reyranellaceae bacterium]